MGREVVPDLLPRIQAAAAEHRDAVEAARLAQVTRDELIAQADQEHITQTAIAKAAGLARSRIVTILGNFESSHYV